MDDAKLRVCALYGSSCTESLPWYLGRIRFILDNHSFSQREQLLGMVLSSAMGDRTLTASELLRVMSEVEGAHRLSMEANYNEGWKV